MSIEIASVVIPTSLNLSGFNAGLKTLERAKIQDVSVNVNLNTKSLERDRRQLEQTLAKPLALTLEVDDTALMTLRRRLQRQAPYKVKAVLEVDTKAVQRAANDVQRSFSKLPAVKIRVDHSDLYEANKHIELKRTHVKDINQWMEANPIKVRVDTSELDAFDSRRTANKRIQVDVEYNDPGYKPTSSRYATSAASSSSSSRSAFDFAKPIDNQTKILDSCIENAADKIVSAIDKGFKSQQKGLLGEVANGLMMGATFTGGQALYDKAAGKLKQKAGQQKEQRQAYQELSYKSTVSSGKEASRLRQQKVQLQKEIAQEQEKAELRQQMLQMNNASIIQPLAKKVGVKAKTKAQAVEGLLKQKTPQQIKNELPYIDNIRQEAAKVSQQVAQMNSAQLKTQLSNTTKQLRDTFKGLKGSGNTGQLSDLGNEIEKEYQNTIALLSQATEEDVRAVLQSTKLQIAKIRKGVSTEQQKITQQQFQTQISGTAQTQRQFLRRAANTRYSPIYQAREAINKGASAIGRAGGQVANAPNFALQQISNENLQKQADKVANKVRGDFLGVADYWNLAPEDLQGVEGLKASLGEIAQLVGDISEPDLIKANLQPLIADFKELTQSIDKYKQAIAEKGSERFLTEDLVQDASKFSGIRTVVTEGLKRRTKRKAVKAAERIKAEYDPSQSEEFDANAGHIFAASGFHGMGGKGSEDFAEKLRIATHGQNYKVHPIVNKHSDLDSPEASTENLRRNVLRGDFNPDDVAMAKKAYAAYMKNQKTQLLAGYSGGGYNVQGAGAILNQLGVPWKGVGIATPNLGITRNVGKNYQAVGLNRDKLITEEVERAKSVGFAAGPDKEFKGRTHAVQEYLATGGDFIVEHLTGQKPDAKRSMSDYKASEYATFSKELNTWLNKLLEFEQENKLGDQDISVIKEGFDNFIQKYEGLPWDKLSSDLKQKYSPYAHSMATDFGEVSNLIGRLKNKPQSQEVNEPIAEASKTVGVGSKFSKLFNNFKRSKDIGQGLSGKQLQRLQTNYQNYFKEVAKVYNVSDIVSAERLPDLKVDAKLLQDYAADALYDIENNQIIVSEELQKALSSSTKDMMNNYSEVLEGLTHEIQHALTLDFGELSLADVGMGLSPVKLKGYHDVSKYAQVRGEEALEQGDPNMGLSEAKGMFSAELNAYDSEQYTKGILENLVAQDTYESAFDNEGFKKEQEAFKSAIDSFEKLFTEGLTRLTAAITEFGKGVSEKVTSVIGGFLSGNRTRKDPSGAGNMRYATVTANSQYLRRMRAQKTTYQPTDLGDPWEEATNVKAEVITGTTSQTPKNDPRGIGQRVRVKVRKPIQNTLESAQKATQQAVEAFNSRLENYVQNNVKETLTEVASLSGKSLDPANMPQVAVDNATTAKLGQQAFYNAKKNQIVISSRMRDLLQSNPEALEKYAKELQPLVAAARKSLDVALPDAEVEEFSKQTGAVYARISTRAKGQRSNMPGVIRQASEGLDGAVDILAQGAKEGANLKRKAELYLQSLKRAAVTPQNMSKPVASFGKSGGIEALAGGDIKSFFAKAPLSTNNSMQSLRVAFGQRSQEPFGVTSPKGESTWERLYNRAIPKPIRQRGQEQREKLQQMYMANPKLPKNLNQLSDLISKKFKIPIDLYARMNVKGITDAVAQVQKIVGGELDKLQERAAALPFLGDMASKAVGGLKLLNVAGVGAGITFMRFLGVITRFTALNALAAQIQLVVLQFDALRKSFMLTANQGGRGAEVFDRVMQSASELGVDKATAATGATEIFGNVTPKMGSAMAEQVNRAAQESSLIYASNPQQSQQIFSAFGQLAQQSTMNMGDFQAIMNAMPGSLDTAARSMGMTNAEFTNFIQNNSVLVEDFLPRFIQQLNVDNQPKLAGAMDTLTTATNKYNNAIVDMQLEVGKTLAPVEKLRVSLMAMVAETIGKWGAGVFAKWGFSMAILSAVKAGIAFKNVFAALFPIIAKLPIVPVAMAAIGLALKHILPLIIKMSAEFLLFQLAIDVVMAVFKSFSNAGGQFTTWAENSASNVTKMSEAFNKASQSAEQFKKSMPTDEKELQATSSRFEDTLIGSIFGKKNVRWAEGQLDKGLSNIPGYKTFAQKEMYDKEEAVQKLRESGGIATQKVFDLRQGKDTSLRDMVAIDKQLEKVRGKRRALAATNPADITGMRQLREEERGLVARKDVVATPIAAAQSAIASQIKTYEDALAKIDEEAREGAWTQEAYDRATSGLKQSLTEAEKAQKYLNSQIKDSATALQALQRHFASLNAQLADNANTLQQGYNKSLVSIYSNNSMSSAQKQFAQQASDQDLLAGKLRANKQTALEMRESLAAQGGEDVLTNWNVDVNTTGVQGFQLLAQRAEQQGNAKEQEVFTQYSRIAELELETSDMEAQVVQRRSEAQQQLRDLNKQVEEYYRGISRQAAESQIQLAQQVSEVQNQQFANQINMAMMGVGDNIISQFVGSLLDSITQIAQAADTDLNAQSQILQAQNAFEDTFRSGEELRRQLPALSASGDLPKIPVEIDLSSVAANSDVRELNTEIKGSVTATQDLENATQGFNSTVADSGSLLSANTDATNGLESAISSVGGAVDNTVQSTDNLNTAVSSTTDSASYLQSQIDANTMSVDQTNASMQGVGSAIDINTQKTALVTEQSKGWWTELLNANNVAASIQGVFTNISNGILDAILKTVDWFKTFANNIPILNQIGQTISGFGQGLAQVGQTVANGVGGAIQQGGNLVNQGVGAVRGMLGMGEGVGKIGAFKILESVGGSIQNVNTYKDLEKHHPSAGRERGRSYGNVDGEFEEIRNTKDGRTLVKKDFILVDQKGSQAAAIPAMAAGFVKVLNDATNTVQIYADKEMKTMIGQSLHMRNIAVKTGDYVRYGQKIGTQSDAGSPGAIHAHIELEAERFKKYIADLKSGNFAGVTGKEQAHSLGDGHNHFGEEDVKKANQQAVQGRTGVAGVSGSVNGMFASMGGGEKAGPSAPGQNSIVRMRRTGQLDNKGLEKLAVDVVNSQGQVVKSFTANSGKANMQNAFGGAGTTRANSNAPLEYGKYDIGAATAGLTAAVGKTFVPIEPQFKTARSSLGIHWDADRPVGAGSAGCIVFATEAEFKAFQAAIKANGVNSLVFEGQGGSNKAPKTMAPPQVASQGAVPQQTQARGKGGVLWGKAAQYAPSDLSGLTDRGRRAMEALKDPKVRAFLDAVSAAELGDQAAAKGGYGYLFGDTRGKETFNPNSMKAHPGRRVPFGKTSSSATGRYQTMDFVWNEEHGRLGLKDMKPQSQEIMAVSRLMYRNILDDIQRGEIQGALNKPGNFDASSEWASIQGNPYKQGTGGGKVSTFLANYQKALREAGSSGGSPMPQMMQQQATGGAPMPQGQAFTPAPAMTVWAPQSVSQAGNARITQSQNVAATQRDEQIRAANDQAVAQTASQTIQALQKSQQSLIQVKKQLRQAGYESRDIGEDVTKMNLENMGPLTLPQQREKAIQDMRRQYRDQGEKVNELIIDRQNRKQAAQAILDLPEGIISPAMRAKFDKILAMPISEDLKKRLRTELDTGSLGEGLKKTLQQSVSQADQELVVLRKAQKDLQTGEGQSLKAAEERFAFEEKAREKAAKFEQESLNIGTLQARLEQLKGQAERGGVGSEAAKQIPAMEALVGLRQTQLDYDKQIQELEEKKRNNTVNKEEADNQIKTLKEKKAITEQTIQENKAYQELVNTRALDTRNREQSMEKARGELAVTRQQLEGLKALPQTDPNRGQIPMLEYQLELQETQLKLQEDLAGVEQQVFKGDRTKEWGEARTAQLKEEYNLSVQNLGVRQKQATTEQQLAQQRAILGIREQELGFSEQLLEAQTRAIELGRQSGDTLGDRFSLQKQQQDLGFEKQILDVKELALQSGKSAEEVAAIETQLRQINDIKLGNIQAEMDKAFADRAFAVNQRIGESNNSVLSAQQSLMSTTGFGMEANRLGKQIAVNEQGMNFANQKRELDEFIKTNNVAAAQANVLRSNLESVNDIKFREIEQQFNPLKGVIDSTAGAMKGAFKSLIKDGKVDFDSFFDGILDSIAEFLSNMLVEQLMGFLSPDKDKNKGGGMFPNATADPNAQPGGGGMEFSGILGGLGGESFLGGELGTTPMAPMYVSAVNSAMGFAAPANNIVPFNSPGFGGSFASGLDSFGLGINSLWGGSSGGGGSKSVSTSLFTGLGGLFDGGQNFTATNPLPVNMTQAKPNLFNSIFGGGAGGGGGNFITNALGMLTGGGGAAKPGGGGGFGSIISMVLPMLTGFLGFAKGGVVGGHSCSHCRYASGGIIGSGKSKKDDQLILAQRGEGILTHAGMQAIGGAAALNAINNGTGYRVPKFATGGTVGGEYGTRGADAVERGQAERNTTRNEPIKLETTVINGTEYATIEQVRAAANQARMDGARDGAKHLTSKMQNSPSFRNRMRF